MKLGTRLSGWADQIADGLGWSFATVRDTLPAPLREFGFRPNARLARLTADGQVEVRAVRERSWLGATRQVPVSAGRSPERLVVELAPAQLFRRRLHLSAPALRRGEAALDMRRDDFTPVPPETARYAARVVESTAGGGAVIETAVVRVEALDAACRAASQSAPDWEVCGSVTPDGRSAYVFAGGRRQRRSPILYAALVLLALAFATVAWTDRAGREARQMEDRRDSLLAMAREQRDQASELSQLEALQAATSDTPRLDGVLDALAEATDRLEDAWSVERIRLVRHGTLQLQTGQPGRNGVGTVVIEQPVEVAP